MSKRNDILEAVVLLSNRFSSPHEITISAIAEQAGVGKGTVYEYFQSKEDIFIEAVGYFINNRLEKLFYLPFQGTFREQFEQLANETTEVIRRNRAFFRMIFISNQLEEYNAEVFCNSISSQRDEFVGKLVGLLSRLAEHGKKEGIIEKIPSERDMIFAFLCVAMALSGIGPASMEFLKEDVRGDFPDFIYSKFVKLLS